MGSPFEKKYTQLTEEDINKVATTYHNWQQVGFETTYQDIPEYCYSASFEDVKKKDFSLVPSKYIEFVNRDENIDFDEKITSLQAEFKELLKAEEESKRELLKVFKELGYEIKL
jgi:type I restriction enzyme M protein